MNRSAALRTPLSALSACGFAGRSGSCFDANVLASAAISCGDAALGRRYRAAADELGVPVARRALRLKTWPVCSVPIFCTLHSLMESMEGRLLRHSAAKHWAEPKGADIGSRCSVRKLDSPSRWLETLPYCSTIIAQSMRQPRIRIAAAGFASQDDVRDVFRPESPSGLSGLFSGGPQRTRISRSFSTSDAVGRMTVMTSVGSSRVLP